MQNHTKSSLAEIAGVFLRLGLLAFGGPAAHIAMMEDEFVRRRQWLNGEEFLDLLSAANLIPGPSSTELAIHLGYRRAGLRGLFVAGVCFIVPAVLMVMGLAELYRDYGRLPQVTGIFYGIKPVIIVIILQALWRLGKSLLKTTSTRLLAVVALALVILQIHQIAILFGLGILFSVFQNMPFKKNPSSAVWVLGTMAAVAWPRWGQAAESAVTEAPSLKSLFLIFLKIGSVVYGSGYVLLAFLHADFVDRSHWLNEAQLLDATAVGQFTPGPVFTTATFIGYFLRGPAGALVATVGIFLPAFVLVAVTARILPALKKSPWMNSFLTGVNVASLALIAGVAWDFGRVAIVDLATVLLAVASGVALFRFRVHSAILIVIGAAVGGFLSLS